MEREGTCIMPGNGQGSVLATNQPISFWGCVSPVTGRISDKRHDLYGSSISGKILVFPYGKGSTGAPLVVLELIKQGKAPAAIVNVETDPLLVAGPIIGKHFFDRAIPVVCLDLKGFESLESGRQAVVDSTRGVVVLTD